MPSKVQQQIDSAQKALDKAKQALDKARSAAASFGKAHVAVILDRSGSMASIQSDMEGALNTFVKEQQSLGIPVDFTFVQFDDDYDVIYDGVDIESVTEQLTLRPRGSTALLDAMGRTITRLRDKVSEGSRVVVAVITDGYENASREWTRRRVFDLVTAQRNAGWEFTFLGANQDAIETGEGLGVLRRASMTYSPTFAGVSASARAFTNSTSDYLLGNAASISYTDEEREEAVS